MASNKHLIMKCWNCGTWNFYCDDIECHCGVHLYEESDPCCVKGQECEVREINLNNLDIEKCTKLV